MYRIIAIRTYLVVGLLSVLSCVGCQRQREIDEPEARSEIQFHAFVNQQLKGADETLSTLAKSGFNIRAYGQGQLYF